MPKAACPVPTCYADTVALFSYFCPTPAFRVTQHAPREGRCAMQEGRKPPNEQPPQGGRPATCWPGQACITKPRAVMAFQPCSGYAGLVYTSWHWLMLADARLIHPHDDGLSIASLHARFENGPQWQSRLAELVRPFAASWRAGACQPVDSCAILLKPPRSAHAARLDLTAFDCPCPVSRVRLGVSCSRSPCLPAPFTFNLVPCQYSSRR